MGAWEVSIHSTKGMPTSTISTLNVWHVLTYLLQLDERPWFQKVLHSSAMRDTTSHPRRGTRNGTKGPCTCLFFVFVFSRNISSASFPTYISLSATSVWASSTRCSEACLEEEGQCDVCIEFAFLYEKVRLSVSACFCIVLGCILNIFLFSFFIVSFLPLLFMYILHFIFCYRLCFWCLLFLWFKLVYPGALSKDDRDFEQSIWTSSIHGDKLYKYWSVVCTAPAIYN